MKVETPETQRLLGGGNSTFFYFSSLKMGEKNPTQLDFFIFFHMGWVETTTPNHQPNGSTVGPHFFPGSGTSRGGGVGWPPESPFWSTAAKKICPVYI